MRVTVLLPSAGTSPGFMNPRQLADHEEAAWFFTFTVAAHGAAGRPALAESGTTLFGTSFRQVWCLPCLAPTMRQHIQPIPRGFACRWLPEPGNRRSTCWQKKWTARPRVSLTHPHARRRPLRRQGPSFFRRRRTQSDGGGARTRVAALAALAPRPSVAGCKSVRSRGARGR